MKTIKQLIGAAALLAAFSLHAQSGVSTNGPTGSFFQTAEQYFTSFNTNLDSTFAASKASLWTGVDSVQGGDANLMNEVGVSYNAYGILSPEVVIRNTGIAGTLVSVQGGLGLNFVVHDARVTFYGDGGDDIGATATTNAKGKTVRPQRFYGEFGVRVQKALTLHTYALVGIAGQFPRNSQVALIGGGITF